VSPQKFLLPRTLLNQPKVGAPRDHPPAPAPMGPHTLGACDVQISGVPTRNFGVPKLALTIPRQGHQQTQPLLPPLPPWGLNLQVSVAGKFQVYPRKFFVSPDSPWLTKGGGTNGPLPCLLLGHMFTHEWHLRHKPDAVLYLHYSTTV
jgi:hypothetical protein